MCTVHHLLDYFQQGFCFGVVFYKLQFFHVLQDFIHKGDIVFDILLKAQSIKIGIGHGIPVGIPAADGQLGVFLLKFLLPEHDGIKHAGIVLAVFENFFHVAAIVEERPGFLDEVKAFFHTVADSDNRAFESVKRAFKALHKHTEQHEVDIGLCLVHTLLITQVELRAIDSAVKTAFIAKITV